jgi:hypothetical protein
MAVTRTGAVNHYVGLAADVKPSLAEEDDVPVGSRFFETDTGWEFVYDGEAWSQVFYPADSGE